PLIFSAKIIHTFCLHAMGQLDEAIRIQRELCETLTGELELSRLGTSWIPSSITHSFLAWSLCETGDYKKALSHAERGHSIAVRAGDVYSQIMGLHAIGRASLLLSENQAATDALTMATELITQHGYETVRPHVTGHLAMALSRIGKSSDAVAKAMPLTDEHTASTTGSQEMILLYNGLAEALFETGAQDESLAWVKRAIDMAEDSQHRCLQVQTYGMRAKLLRRKGADESSVAVDLKRMADISEEFGIEAPPLI
ncbi:MAG: tetratricopeptide repeat protein, partial [Pseudomonadota bacterium]